MANPPPPTPEEKGPPFDRDAEAACLGSCLIDERAYQIAADIVKDTDFYLHQHRVIWNAMGAIYERGDDLDPVVIESQLRDMKALNDCGGMAYVIQLLTTTPTSANVETYAKLVKRGSLRRMLIDFASRMANLASDDMADTPTILKRVDTLFSHVQELDTHDKERETIIGDAAANLYEEIAAVARGEEVPIIPSLFPDVNELIDGYSPGQLITVAARPGMGKSIYLMNEAVYQAKVLGKAVAFFSLEMSEKQYTARTLSSESNIPHADIRRRRLTGLQHQMYTKACANMDEWHLWINETPAISPRYLRRALDRYKRQGGLDMVFIDYLQLMSCGVTSMDAENEVQKLNLVSKALHEIAQEFEIPIMAAAQLNRNLESRSDKRPGLADLKGSGSIEADSDVVMFIYREEKYNPSAVPGEAELIIAKARDAEVGTVMLKFEGAFARFQPTEHYNLNGDESWKT